MTVRCRRFVVEGRVQGVGYRAFVVRTAGPLGLRGHARNLPDGTVEVVAAGTVDGLAALESALRAGPPHGRVDRLSVTDMPPQEPLPSSFSVK